MPRAYRSSPFAVNGAGLCLAALALGLLPYFPNSIVSLGTTFPIVLPHYDLPDGEMVVGLFACRAEPFCLHQMGS